MITDEEKIEMVTDAAVGADVDIRTDYSGDFMFGKECFGIVCDVKQYGLFLVRLAEEDSDLARELALSVRTDGMGLSTIFYWQNLETGGE